MPKSKQPNGSSRSLGIREKQPTLRPQAAAAPAFSRLAHLLYTMPWAAFALDKQGCITFITAMAEKVWGLKPDSCLGHKLADISAAFLPELKQELLRALA